MYAITDSTCQDILRSLCGLLFKQTVRRLVLQEQRRQQRLTDSSGGLPPFSPLPPVQTNQVWGLQEQKRQQRGIRSHHEDTKAQSSGPPDQRFFSVSPCLCGSKPPGLSAVGQSLLPLRPPVPTNRRTIGFTGDNRGNRELGTGIELVRRPASVLSVTSCSKQNRQTIGFTGARRGRRGRQTDGIAGLTKSLRCYRYLPNNRHKG
jgi:hypothetical protein